MPVVIVDYTPRYFYPLDEGEWKLPQYEFTTKSITDSNDENENKYDQDKNEKSDYSIYKLRRLYGPSTQQQDTINKINSILLNNALKVKDGRIINNKVTIDFLEYNKIPSPPYATRTATKISPDVYDNQILPLLQELQYVFTLKKGGSRRRRARRPSRKYKKSAKRVFRKKSRSTRRR